MNVNNLKIGKKLIWDAPEPFPGYSHDKENSGRVIYPALVINNKPFNKNLGILIKTGSIQNWMEGEIEYLREPTEEELKTLTWPSDGKL